MRSDAVAALEPRLRGLGEDVRNGTRFGLAGERVSISTRAIGGPLELELLCAATPAARVRQFCALTSFPDILPEWGYGFWKSRDVHEHLGSSTARADSGPARRRDAHRMARGLLVDVVGRRA